MTDFILLSMTLLLPLWHHSTAVVWSGVVSVLKHRNQSAFLHIRFPRLRVDDVCELVFGYRPEIRSVVTADL